MAVYDGLGKRVQQGSQGAFGRLKRNAEVTRLNTAVSELEQDVSNDFEKLGRVFYRKYAASGSPDPDMAPNFLELDEKTTQLEDYKEQIRNLKGIRKCPACGQDISANAVFCSYCGAKQELVISITVRPSEKVCANCGAVLEPDAAFCPRCGQRYEPPEDGGAQKTIAAEKEAEPGGNAPETPVPDAAPDFAADSVLKEEPEPDAEIVAEADPERPES